MPRAKKGVQRPIRCYLCGHRFEVSGQTMSTACPGCSSAIMVEDLIIKSYMPVTDLQTCGRIRITRRGRVAAKRIQCGDGIECEGAIEGSIETDGDVTLGPQASWKGKALQSRSLNISDGATVDGIVIVPWLRPEVEDDDTTRPSAPDTPTKKKTATKKKTTTLKKKTVSRKKTPTKKSVNRRRSTATPARK